MPEWPCIWNSKWECKHMLRPLGVGGSLGGGVAFPIDPDFQRNILPTSNVVWTHITQLSVCSLLTPTAVSLIWFSFLFFFFFKTLVHTWRGQQILAEHWKEEAPFTYFFSLSLIKCREQERCIIERQKPRKKQNYNMYKSSKYNLNYCTANSRFPVKMQHEPQKW